MPFEPTQRYDDIIDLPHHQSRKHPHMPRRNRAAQFMPFAALAGYDAIIAETARNTQERVTLGDDEKAMLDERLRTMLSKLNAHPKVELVVFQPDNAKPGGRYVTIEGRALRFDPNRRTITMDDGETVAIDDIIALDLA